jgi:beta-glucosidase-like glycosyl hydrolase
LNIGPSADVCPEGGVNLSALCFGTTPSQVAAYAAAFNSGHHDRGVLTALKHVPFTSGSETSPIYEPANIALFREVARRGPSDVIVVRLKAAEPPAVPYWAFRFHASKNNNKRIFRHPSFQAALIVDLDAGSRGAPVRQGEAIVKALQLGGDAILIRDSSKIQGDLTDVAYDAVRTAIEANRLDMARVEEAHQRVQRLKARLRAIQHRTLTVQSEAPRSELR